MVLDHIEVLAEIQTERRRQNARWGAQNHQNLYWLGILTEELGEVAKAMIEDRPSDDVRHEVIHLAAVGVAFIECLDRRTAEYE